MPRGALLLVGMLVGAGLAMQAGVNAQLRQFVGSPFRAALANFSVGLVALVCIVLLTSGNPPAFRATAWWMWIGGLLGAAYVVGSVLLAPRLGATALAGTLVAGQLLAAVAFDHWGLLGYVVVPLSGRRALGIALLLAGVLLIQRR